MDDLRSRLSLDYDDFVEVLRAMLVEMESYDILYADASQMEVSDLAAWKQTLKLAAKAAIVRLEASTQQVMRNNPSGTIDSIMFDIGLRLNVTAQGSRRYNLDNRMTRAMRRV